MSKLNATGLQASEDTGLKARVPTIEKKEFCELQVGGKEPVTLDTNVGDAVIDFTEKLTPAAHAWRLQLWGAVPGH